MLSSCGAGQRNHFHSPPCNKAACLDALCSGLVQCRQKEDSEQRRHECASKPAYVGLTKLLNGSDPQTLLAAGERSQQSCCFKHKASAAPRVLLVGSFLSRTAFQNSWLVLQFCVCGHEHLLPLKPKSSWEAQFTRNFALLALRSFRGAKGGHVPEPSKTL